MKTRAMRAPRRLKPRSSQAARRASGPPDRLAKMVVVTVPMLLPRVAAIAARTGRTPASARPTKRLVTAELLWTTAVNDRARGQRRPVARLSGRQKGSEPRRRAELGERAAEGPQAVKESTDAHQRFPACVDAGTWDPLQEKACYKQGKAQITEPQSDDLAGDGRADVSAQNDGKGVLQAQHPRRHQADGHRVGSAGALN